LHVSSEELGQRQRKITIVVTDDDVARAKQDVAKELGKRARVPGYRPGTAPLDRLEALLGAEALESEAVEKLAQRGARQAVEPGEAYTGVSVDANVVGRDPLTIEVTVPLQPTVTLGDYRALRVPAPNLPDVGDDEVDAVLQGWRREMAVLTDVERAAAAGDIVTLSLVGRHADAVVFEDEALTLALDPDRFDATRLPPAVIDALIGALAGQALDFTLTYPAFWPAAELQEQPVAFSGTVARVAELQLPELDDTLAATLADVDSVEGLRARVRAQMEERARMALQDQHIESALDALIAAASVDFPPQLLNAEIARYVHDLKAKVEEQGLAFEQWLGLQPEGAEALYAQIEGEADKRIRRQLVLTEFCAAEGIRVRSNEIDDEVKFFSRLVGAGKKDGRGGPGTKGDRSRRGPMPSVHEMRSSFGARILSSRAIARLMAITSGRADGAATPDDAVTTAEPA